MHFSARKSWFWGRHAIAALAMLLANEHWSVFSLFHGDEIQRTSAGILAQIGATMMGFVLALVGVLASLASTRLLRNMQRSGHFNVLLALLLVTALVFGFLTVVGVVISMMTTITKCYTYILIFFALWAVLLLLDSMTKLWDVVSVIHPGGDTLE